MNAHAPVTEPPSGAQPAASAGSTLSRVFPFAERTITAATAFRSAGTHLSALERVASGAGSWAQRSAAVQSYIASHAGPAAHMYSAGSIPVNLPGSVAPMAVAGGGGTPFFDLLMNAAPELRSGMGATLTEEEFRRALSSTARETRRRTANAATLAAALSVLVEGKTLYDLVQELKESEKGWELDALEVNALVKDTSDIKDYLGILRGHLHSLETSTHDGHPVASPSQDEIDTIEELVIELQYRLRDITRRIDDITLTMHDRHVSLRQIRGSLQADAVVNSVYAGVRGLELFYMALSMNMWAVALQSVSFVGHAVMGALAASRAFDAKRSMDRIVGHLETLAETRAGVAEMEADFYACQRAIRPYLRGAI